MFDTKDWAKANQYEDIVMEDAHIMSSSVVEPDDTPTKYQVYIYTNPPPYKQWYSRFITPSQGPWVSKKCNLREDMIHQYEV